ncbi:MAG TPA: ABC transporter ATP-binding protein [Butyrivibrio sp.]|nr:ABC transporter ATP-binding protein [Butyrivibrio sp.]
MIEISLINKIYDSGKENSYQALRDVSLSIKKGEFVGIIGKSGAGKSTLMHILGLIDSSTSGTYIFDGVDVSKLSDSKRAKLRNEKIGIVLQDFALMEKSSVYENVSIPLIIGRKIQKTVEQNKRINDILDEMGMLEFANKRVSKLSGGQKQRVAIARAMVNNPKVLLADEPTGALDEKTSREIMGVFEELNKKGTTVIIITHDMEVAKMCDRVVEIRDGKLV